MHNAITLLSLGLTVVYLQYAWQVIVEWLPATKKLKTSATPKWGSTEWLILGIFTGFVAGFADNVIWGLLWSFDYLGLSFAEEAFSSGVSFNVFFRQTLGIISAFAHIKAALLWDSGVKPISHFRVWSLGVLSMITLSIVSHSL